jgi:methyltransferase (TIGR00027 family)
MESERADAHFRDPFARLLAGERGERIVESSPWGKRSASILVVRTCVFDELILDAIRGQGVDLVLNLGAGLDTRPYRMDLPAELRWIEVDLPGILDYKQGKLAGQKPRCALETVRLDLSDSRARKELFGKIDREARKVLVITEGLVVYLPREQVESLAKDLSARSHFHYWLLDFNSPELLKMLEKVWGKMLREGSSRMQFAVEEGPEFFRPFGWKPDRIRVPMDEAVRLDRMMQFPWWQRLLATFASKARRESYRKMSTFARLERI